MNAKLSPSGPTISETARIPAQAVPAIGAGVLSTVLVPCLGALPGDVATASVNTVADLVAIAARVTAADALQVTFTSVAGFAGGPVDVSVGVAHQ